MSGMKVKVGDGGGGEGRWMTTRSMANEVKERCLINHLVLESVFEYCSVKDLKVVRQVSPLWRDCARKKWNKSVKLRISHVPEGSSDETEKEKCKLFLQVIKSDHPLETGSQGHWTTFCAQIKTLELTFVIFPSVQSLRNALFRCFPNLESLIFGPKNGLQCGHVSSEPTGSLTVTEDQQNRSLKHLKVDLTGVDFLLPWMDVLSHFPSLEKIEVSSLCFNAIGRIEKIFQTVNQIREEDPSKLNLKHISIKMLNFDRVFVFPAAIATLMDRRLQLESLELELTGLPGRLSTPLREILQAHAGTLKMLVFDRGPGVLFSQDSGYPQLLKLQDLRMRLCFSMDSIEFLKLTPNLRKLQLIPCYPQDRQAPQSNFARFPIMLNACKNLDIWDFPMAFSAENWKSLIEWTPNVESLRIFGVDNARFAMICEGWTKLVELYLGESEVDSSGITGWDEEDVQRSSNRTAALPMAVPRANIPALKNLQILKMIAPADTPIKPMIHRVAGFHGIEMLPDLRRLRIQYYAMLPKDHNYWKKLQERYPFSL